MHYLLILIYKHVGILPPEDTQFVCSDTSLKNCVEDKHKKKLKIDKKAGKDKEQMNELI